MKKRLNDNAELRKYHFGGEVSWLNLSEADREWLSKSSTIKQLVKKHILFEQGSVASSVYVLRKGKVKATQSNRDGSHQILFLYTEGDVFGYRPLLSDEPQPLSIVALENCEIVVISKARFFELLESSLTLSHQLLVSLSREFSILANRINSFTQRSARERLALALLLLQDKYKDISAPQEAAPITLTRSDFADYVGTSLETLVRLLTEFKTLGLVHIEGKKIFVVNSRKLMQIAALE